jgi:hypothetical protein
MHMEPWDGGDHRPTVVLLPVTWTVTVCVKRYVITKDKLITCLEVGIWDYQPDEVVEKGRVGPAN